MLRKRRKIKRLHQLIQEKKSNSNQSQSNDGQIPKPEEALSSDLYTSINALQSIYENCSDVVFRPFLIEGNDKAVLVYINGLTDVEEVNANVLTPLMKTDNNQQSKEQGNEQQNQQHTNHQVDQQLLDQLLNENSVQQNKHQESDQKDQQLKDLFDQLINEQTGQQKQSETNQSNQKQNKQTGQQNKEQTGQAQDQKLNKLFDQLLKQQSAQQDHQQSNQQQNQQLKEQLQHLVNQQSTTQQRNKFTSILEKKISVSDVKEIQTYSDVISEISAGHPVIFIDQCNSAFSVGLAKWEKRAIEEPSAESVIRGPREGFIESIGVNTAMLRRRIRSPKLKLEQMEIGRITKTTVILSYIDGLADQTLIDEAKSRLNRIDIDGVLESEYIEEFIEDNPSSPFPQILNTERVDVISSYLLEGHIAIFVDGSPFVLVAPITFYSLMQASEDYYQRPMLSTAIRWLRYLFIIIALLLPSLYVAVLTFHHEMVPTTLLISMAASREPIPFPAVIEALLMEIMFEALREAGLRLPKQVGAAVSIVGALVIGQAAVEAGIVSAPMVMVVAVTGIASFSIPRYNAGMALRMLRFPMLILGGMLGLLGIMLGVIAIVVHLCTLRSFGVPYLSPMAPMKGKDMKDVLMRLPRWNHTSRPHLTGNYNKYRESPNQKPGPTKGGE
ncbi:spore germination protein [Anaerobacillus sp. MEB173]|uniref:spore germination protein n=1 Tax=Anaerobacillus sp. MEB173 TaxID=3383345 RepID=UPI003F910152